jgi:hypothetical protein
MSVPRSSSHSYVGRQKNHVAAAGKGLFVPAPVLASLHAEASIAVGQSVAALQVQRSPRLSCFFAGWAAFRRPTFKYTVSACSRNLRNSWLRNVHK